MSERPERPGRFPCPSTRHSYVRRHNGLTHTHTHSGTGQHTQSHSHFCRELRSAASSCFWPLFELLFWVGPALCVFSIDLNLLLGNLWLLSTDFLAAYRRHSAGSGTGICIRPIPSILPIPPANCSNFLIYFSQANEPKSLALPSWLAGLGPPLKL